MNGLYCTLSMSTIFQTSSIVEHQMPRGCKKDERVKKRGRSAIAWKQFWKTIMMKPDAYVPESLLT